MALVVSAHSIVLNLLSIYRDHGWDAATVRNILENDLISCPSFEAKEIRQELFYLNKATQCDGQLLVYNLENKEDYSIFLNHCIDSGLDLGLHIASKHCLWKKDVLVYGYTDGCAKSIHAVQHINCDDFVLCIRADESIDYRGFVFDRGVVTWTTVSEQYLDYCNLGFFWKTYSYVLSLFKTKFAHINYYKPFRYTSMRTSLLDFSLGSQILPGISFCVPRGEIAMAKKLDGLQSGYLKAV